MFQGGGARRSAALTLPASVAGLARLPLKTWFAIGAVAGLGALVVLLTLRQREEPFVLGQEMAQASANEKARLASGPIGPSPMPKGEYDPESGDDDFSSITERPLDRELRDLVRSSIGWTPEQRADVRRRISMAELYTLIQFAKRCAVLALNEQSITPAQDGLTALTLVDETRIDPRDAMWAIGLLAHALESVGADRARLAGIASAFSTPGMARIVRRVQEPSRLSDWLYARIDTDGGRIGLIRSGGERYEPTIDMTGLALRLAANLGRGRYVARPEIASEMPSAWFDEGARAGAEQLLAKSHAAIGIDATLRRGQTDNPSAQEFMQWVVEMPTAADADALVRLSGTNPRRGRRFIIGVASGRLFSQIVAGSMLPGVEPFESSESIALIAEDTRALLEQAVHAAR